MTVSSQTNKVIYIGNGIAKEFAIPFLFLDQSDVKVTQKLNDIQTERTDWEIVSGNIVFKAAPENGAEIAIVREVPLTQETDYRDNEILHAETLERNFDKLTMQVQQLKEQIDRAVTVDMFDDTQAASLIPSIRKAVSDCAEAVKTAQALKAETNELLSAAMRQANDAVTTLTSKANADLSNLSVEGKHRISSFGSSSLVKVVDIFTSPITNVLQTYTAPANGLVQICLEIQGGSLTFYNETTSEDSVFGNSNGNGLNTVKVHARKGDVIKTQTYSSQATIYHSEFIYDEGEI